MTSPVAVRALAITVGAGRTRPKGGRLTIEWPDPVAGLAQALRNLPPWVEQWWSGSAFREDYRKEEYWERSDLVGTDLDYRDEEGRHSPVPEAFRERLGGRRPNLPGNVAHPTPRGYRTVFLLDRPVRDPATWRDAARGAVAKVKASLDAQHLSAEIIGGRQRAGLVVDVGASTDPARLWWAPRAVVNGESRDAEVVVLEEVPTSVEVLVALGRIGARRQRRPVRAKNREHGASRYGLAVLRHACERVEGAAEGDRHLTLRRRALLVAGYVEGGDIEESLARDCLLSAAMGSDLPEREARSLIDWAFERGKKQPLAGPRWGARR